ncbi:MAG: exodeoxyribonuclease VII large subunit [Alphaproteobacteria bacterium]|nr:exodeoxyribonuclease VII large subunit [Alphaproteobacteria bacterium]
MSEAAAKPNLPEYSVSEIAGALKRTVEDTFPFVRVRGEISGLKFATSGHVYFDLKDDKAVLNAIIWKQTARLMKLRPEAGLEVVAIGRITTYPGSSRYQIIVEQLELAGAGALMAMLEERKKRLAAEGLFAAERKKPLPFLPEIVGVVTSPTGAVIRDIMHRLNDRFPRRVLLWPVAVQGEKAAAEIAAAITGFNAFTANRPDVLIVARGGGSIEDLMAFNEEAVVRAAFASAIPLISAVGHETDTTLIDFVSDRRAPTPTAAAEMAVPIRRELIAQVMDFERRTLRCFSKGMEDRKRHLGQLARVLPRADQLFAAPRQRFDHAAEKLGNALKRNLQEHKRAFAEAAALLRPRPIARHIGVCGERTEVLGRRLARSQTVRLAEARQRLDALGRLLEGVSYRGALERGFALVRGPDGRVRRRAGEVASGEALSLTFVDGEVGAVASAVPTSVTQPKPRAKAKPAGGQGDLF